MIENINDIIEGATNSIINDLNLADTEGEVEVMAQKRMSLCDTCIQNVPHFIKKRMCNVCGCKLSWMVRSDKTCRKGYWDTNQVAEEDLIKNK